MVASKSVAAIFQGYDSVNCCGLSTAIEGDVRIVGGVSKVEGSICEDAQTLHRALGFGQSITVGVSLVELGEKMDFVKSLNLTAHSIAIVVRAYHEEGTETVTHSRLKKEVQPPVGEEQLKNFCCSYGDSYISSLTKGSECYAVYHFSAKSREEKKSVSTELSAKGVARLFTVGLSLQDSVDHVRKSSNVSYTFHFQVSGIANPVLAQSAKPAEFLKYALNFTSIPPDAPAVLSYESSGYERVPGIGNFDLIVRNRAYFLGHMGLASDLRHLRELSDDINALKVTYDFYEFCDQTLASNRQQVLSDIDAIRPQVTDFRNEPTANFAARPPLKSLAMKSPQLDYSVGYSEAWGGRGGNQFDFRANVFNFLNHQAYISAIGISTGNSGGPAGKAKKRSYKSDKVYKITVTYMSKAGTVYDEAYGGDGGSTQNVQRLFPGQFVTKVAGRVSDELNHLELTLSDGKTISGGGDGGTPFSWDVPENSKFVGFGGRCGERLNQIKAVYVTLKPAKW